MGNSQSADISEQEAASISKVTGFTKSQIQKIYHRSVVLVLSEPSPSTIHPVWRIPGVRNIFSDSFNLIGSQRAFWIEMIYSQSRNSLWTHLRKELSIYSCQLKKNQNVILQNFVLCWLIFNQPMKKPPTKCPIQDRFPTSFTPLRTTIIPESILGYVKFSQISACGGQIWTQAWLMLHEIELVKPIKAVSKAKLVFHLFDSNKSGKISKGEILDVLRYMVGANIGAENLEAIAERCLVEVRFGSNSEPAILYIGYMLPPAICYPYRYNLFKLQGRH